MKKLLLGPYVGDIIQEITTFRPYIKHITELMNVDEVIISSHYNRKFFYDWADKFIPVPSEFTENIKNQKGYIHKNLSKIDYTRMIKRLVNDHNNIDQFSLPYTKTTSPIPFQEKSYHPFICPKIDIPNKDFIIFIHNGSKSMISILEDLKEYYEVISIDKNLNDIFIDNGCVNYELLFNFLHKARMVITPYSHWAFVSNIQGLPLFYWGDDASMYKSDGVYGFNNDKSFSVKISSGIVKQIKYSYNKLWDK